MKDILKGFGVGLVLFLLAPVALFLGGWYASTVIDFLFKLVR